jgi:hypothetical protein
MHSFWKNPFISSCYRQTLRLAFSFPLFSFSLSTTVKANQSETMQSREQKKGKRIERANTTKQQH